MTLTRLLAVARAGGMIGALHLILAPVAPACSLDCAFRCRANGLKRGDEFFVLLQCFGNGVFRQVVFISANGLEQSNAEVALVLATGKIACSWFERYNERQNLGGKL